MIKKTVLSIVVFVVVLISALALSMPPKNSCKYATENDDIVATLTASDILLTNSCEIDSNGKVSITGSDAYVIFGDLDYSFQTVVLNFSKTKAGFLGHLYIDSGNGFNEAESYSSACFSGDSSIVFAANQTTASSVRVDVDSDYVLESVELHSEAAQLVYSKLYCSPWVYVISAVVALLAAAVALLLEVKFSYCDVIIKFFVSRKNTIEKGFNSLLACAALSIIVEYIIGHFVVGVSSIGTYFNLYRFVFIFAATFSIVFLILCKDIVSSKFENVFLGICLIMGITMVLVCPFGHASWDIDSHYKWVLNASFIGDTYVTQADNYVFTNNTFYWPAASAAQNLTNIQEMNNAYKIVISQTAGQTTIAHIPSGFFVALARFAGGSFYQVVTFGRLANVLVYAFVCYFAIKKLKSGKMILSVVALFPTNLFLATNFSYDYWVTCFTMLGVAYFVSELQQPDREVTVKDTLIMCGAFVIGSLPKLIYAVLLVLPFFMKLNKIKNKKKYYGLCAIAIVFLFVLLLMRTFAEAEAGGDFRGGEGVSSVGQMKYILSNPLEYANTLVKFLLGYLSFATMPQYISNFAYVGLGSGAVVFIILMIVTAFTDKNEYDKRSTGWLVKAVSIALFLVVSVLVATSLYIAFTPVGYGTVLGCQPRYIIPALYPLLAIIGYNGFNNKINRTVYNYLVLIPCCAVVFYNMYSTMVVTWL